MKFNPLVPELAVTDIASSTHFYTQVLGFTIEYKRDETKFAFISLDGSQIMIEQINNNWDTGPMEKPYGRGINFQMFVNDVDKIVASLKKHKYPIFREMMTNWYRVDNKTVGSKEFLVQDPDGYLLRFAQDLGEKKE